MDPIDLHFPSAGIDVSLAFEKQPNRPVRQDKYARTTPVGINVRATDHVGRLIGGSRIGLEKYLALRPGDVEYITQSLDILVATGVNDPGGGTVQPSQSGRLVLLVAVSQGNVYTCPAGGTVWTAAINSTGETPPLNITGLMQSTVNNQKMFFADGTNKVYYTPLDNTLRTWTLTDGTFPIDSDGNTPRLICTWRGRIVMSGLLKDPSLIVMSKVSDPFNFDYAPPLPVPADSAWSGAIGPQGKPPDVITALIPYTDDILIIGMDSSLALFRGDPNYGGQIDAVTTTIGIAWGKAWCMDPAGTVFFFSNRTGVFAFVPGQQPTRISQPIDTLLLDVDTGENCVLLQWNDRYKQLHVWITLLTAPFATNHYCWEQRTNAWWQDQFTNTSLNPLCCTTLDGNEANDRVALIGSWTGYVYSISSEATTDDGTSIESEVIIGPFLTKFDDSVLLKEVQGILGETSGTVTYEVLVGETAEDALSSTAVASGTWSGGRNFTDMVMRAGYAAYVRITSTNAWSLESIRAVVGSQGKIRQRGK